MATAENGGAHLGGSRSAQKNSPRYNPKGRTQGLGSDGRRGQEKPSRAEGRLFSLAVLAVMVELLWLLC